MKILLVNPPQFSTYVQPPMGLASIAAVLEQSGHEVRIADADAGGFDSAAIASQADGTDLVGLTAMTPTINAALKIAHQIKTRNPGVPIVLGGAHATLLPEETLANAPQVDVIVRGEGEEAILELLPVVKNGSSFGDVPGVSYRTGDALVNNAPKASHVDLDNLPFLAYHLLPWDRYKPHPPHGRALPFAGMITSRGCPYRCAYCSKPIFGKQFRAQTPDRVLEEIAYHKRKLGIRELAFYDDVFTLDKKRVHAIAEGMLRRGLRIHWTCETRVNLVDRDLLRDMKRAGCYSIAYGIESASQDILDAMSKDISTEQVEEAVRTTREVGIQTIGYFMVGSPGETPESIQKTIAFAKKLKLDFAQFAVTTPFPGTKLFEMLKANINMSDVSWDAFLYANTSGKTAPVFETEKLNRADLEHWEKKAYREFYLRPSYVWQRIGRIRSIGDLDVNVKGFSMLLKTIAHKPPARHEV